MARRRSPDRKTLEIATYLYQQVAAEADRQGRTTASLATEIITAWLLNRQQRPLPVQHQEQS